MSLTDEQCRAMETWANDAAVKEIEILKAELHILAESFFLNMPCNKCPAKNLCKQQHPATHCGSVVKRWAKEHRHQLKPAPREE